MKTVRRIALGLFLLAVVTVLLLVWMVFTRSGTRTAAVIVPLVMTQQASIGQAQGTLGKTVKLTDLRFFDQNTGLDLTVEQMTVSFELRGMMQGQLRVREATLSGFTLVRHAGSNASAKSGAKTGLPLDIEIDHAILDRGTVRIGALTISVKRMEFAGRYTKGKIEVTRMRVSGQLGNHQITGSGELSLLPGRQLTGNVWIGAGDSTLHVFGTGGSALDVTAELSDVSASDWIPYARGTLAARLRATGDWPLVSMDATARIHDAALGSDPLGDVTLVLAGTLPDHSVRLEIAGTRLKSELTAHGSYTTGHWAADIRALALQPEWAPPVALEAPAHIEVSQSDAEMSLRYTINSLSLNVLARLVLPESRLSVEGSLEGSGNVQHRADGSFAGRAALTIPTLRIVQSGSGEPPIHLDCQDTELVAVLDGESARMQVGATLANEGKLSGQLQVTHIGTENPQLLGTATLQLQSLDELAWLFPQLSALQGTGQIVAAIRGPVREPQITAQAQADAVSLGVPALGLTLQEGSASARLAKDAANLSARVRSGEGTLRVDGNATLTEIHLSAQGSNLLAANIPGARIVVSPQLRIDGPTLEPALTGTLAIPTADLDLGKLSFAAGQRASPDVVVIDREQAPPQDRNLSTDVTMILGQKVRLTGFGLDSRLQGELRVTERPGAAPTAVGEIRVEGTYDAYGRKLTIERGRLQFTGTSLDQPEIDIVAVRKIRDVTAKLHVSGTPQHPQLSVSADPAMSTNEALSYLVAGKPSGDERNEQDMLLHSAAQTVGGKFSDRLTHGVAGWIGMDSAGVEQSAELGSAAFIVSKYLSPRFFVSYGIGLFEPGHVTNLRYQLSPHWSLEADQTPTDQRAGLIYRIEK